MAAASGRTLWRSIRGRFLVGAILRKPLWVQNTPSAASLQRKQLPFRIFSTEAGQTGSEEPALLDTESRFKENPWQYLASEEYIERYGNNPVWLGYRRNHKGRIPPQKTRKTCIRGTHVCGNPCPVCRDHNLFLDYRNVKLLEQFICPHTGIIYHPTRTGICMKKYKQLTQAIQQARDHGLLFFHIPFISFQGQDYSNQHPAVTATPPSPALQDKTAWYDWYDWQQPAEKDIALMRRIYKNYLREESGPP